MASDIVDHFIIMFAKIVVTFPLQPIHASTGNKVKIRMTVINLIKLVLLLCFEMCASPNLIVVSICLFNINSINEIN